MYLRSLKVEHLKLFESLALDLEILPRAPSTATPKLRKWTAIIGENDAPEASNSNILVDDLVVGESQTYADFLVRLDRPNTGTVTVNYSTTVGTATSHLGQDYVSQSGYLTFAAGETVKTVRVALIEPLTDDAEVKRALGDLFVAVFG